jgi:DNA-directed RNA polymerase specialized sigma24 family protein
MSAKPEVQIDERVKELSERYSFHLERWTHGRTPMWARGAFNPRDVVQETLMQVALRGGDGVAGPDQAVLDCLRRALYDNVLLKVHLARRATAELRQAVKSSAELHLHDPALGAELLKRYEAGLRRLKPLDREAIIARAELGLPWSEVTELLQKTGVAAARMTVSRALIRLAREMAYERSR